ncbi:MAG: hypothetical protein U0995_05155 [Erythrobacter sp.]|nr:hypothetical protein [Erythrobacter sp.]MDZ4275404.1 hypothetical protein [Erythrobacter sp.]
MGDKVVACLLVAALASASTPALADFQDGIIRIGDECFIDIGVGVLVQTPCPRQVNGGN